MKRQIVLSMLLALLLCGCARSKSDSISNFAVGTDYPVQNRGYVCSDESSLLAAKNAFNSSAEFIAQPNCTQIASGDTVTITSLNDRILIVRISNGMYRGTPTS